MQLHPYQSTTLTNIDKSLYLFGNDAVIMCAPTGAGKTVMFSEYTLRKVQNGLTVMILCNRKELISQAHSKLKRFGLDGVCITPKYRGQLSSLYIASVDTLRRRQYPKIDLLIVDECHIRSFDPTVIYYRNQGAKIIGATATPIRSGKAQFKPLEKTQSKLHEDYTGQLIDLYQDLIISTSISELITQEYLVPAISYGPELDTSNINKKGNEFDEDSAFKAFDKPKLYSGVVDNYLKWAEGKKAICFNINVEHSIKTAQAFNERGVSAIHIDGTTPDHIRDKAFSDFKNGLIKILCNVGIATTGYDEPSVECVIVNRPTMSLSLWLQMCGRGGRTMIGKTHFVIIDQGGNLWRHGWWEDEREWTLDHEIMKSKLGVPPVKMCPHCEALIHATSKNCKFCGGEIKAPQLQDGITPADRLPETQEAKFALLKRTPTIPSEDLTKMDLLDLEKYRQNKDYKVSWICRQLWLRPDQDTFSYAIIKGYSRSWAMKQVSLAQEARVATKKEIWDFMRSNKHLSPEDIKDYAIKKLKQNHSKVMMQNIVPKILEEFEKLKARNGSSINKASQSDAVVSPSFTQPQAVNPFAFTLVNKS